MHNYIYNNLPPTLNGMFDSRKMITFRLKTCHKALQEGELRVCEIMLESVLALKGTL